MKIIKIIKRVGNSVVDYRYEVLIDNGKILSDLNELDDVTDFKIRRMNIKTEKTNFYKEKFQTLILTQDELFEAENIDFYKEDINKLDIGFTKQIVFNELKDTYNKIKDVYYGYKFWFRFIKYKLKI